MLHNAFGVGIYIHSVVAQETDEGDAAGVGQFDGQAGGGGDGGDTGDACQQGLLDDLERGATTNEQDMLIIRKRIMQQAISDQFIDGIVTAHIFAQEEQFSAGGEEAGGMQSACVCKYVLLLAQACRKRVEDGWRNMRLILW